MTTATATARVSIIHVCRKRTSLLLPDCIFNQITGTATCSTSAGKTRSEFHLQGQASANLPSTFSADYRPHSSCIHQLGQFLFGNFRSLFHIVAEKLKFHVTKLTQQRHVR